MFAHTKTVVLLGAVLVAVTSVPASAQGGPGMYGGGPGMMGGYGPGSGEWRGGGWGMWGGFGPDRMLDRLDGRLAFLKAELKITDAQSAAWNKLSDAIKVSAKSMASRMKSVFSADEKAKTLPQRLAVHEEFMAARLEEIKSVNAAFKLLYAELSEAQKKEADTLVLPMMGMGMGFGRGAGMGPGWRR
jgi:hypothetical protein